MTHLRIFQGTLLLFILWAIVYVYLESQPVNSFTFVTQHGEAKTYCMGISTTDTPDYATYASKAKAWAQHDADELQTAVAVFYRGNFVSLVNPTKK